MVAAKINSQARIQSCTILNSDFCFCLYPCQFDPIVQATPVHYISLLNTTRRKSYIPTDLPLLWKMLINLLNQLSSQRVCQSPGRAPLALRDSDLAESNHGFNSGPAQSESILLHECALPTAYNIAKLSHTSRH
jgi:hypothetical protein